MMIPVVLLLVFSTLPVRTSSETDGPTLVLAGGSVFDPRTGTAGEPCQLWIEGSRVLGQRALDAETPAGARVLDVRGCTLLPGLFDLHAHVYVPGGSMTAARFSAPEENLRSHLVCGVTNVVDLHADEGSIFALRDAAREAPDMARLYCAGAAFTAPGGHGTQFGIAAHAVSSPGEVEQHLADLLARGPDVLKAIVEHGGWSGLPALPALPKELLCAVSAGAGRAGLPLFCHVWRLDEARDAVACGADALVHGIFVGDADDTLARAMKDGGTAYVPTLAVVVGARRAARGEHSYDHPLVRAALHPEVVEAVTEPGGTSWATMSEIGGGEAQHLANLKRLADAGVAIGTGTDSGNPLTPHGPALLLELELYVEAGLTPAQALAAGTLGSARILGVEERFGTLDAGKTADVVAIRGRPHERIQDVWEVAEVVKAGLVVDRDALAARHAGTDSELEVLVADRDVGWEIDTFDDGDLATLWGGRWVASEDRVAGGKSEAEPSVAAGLLRVEGEVREGFQWGPWAGVAVWWHPERRIAVDASAFIGFELRVRGTPRPYTFTVQRAAVKDFNVFSTRLAVGEEWSEVRVPFDGLRQIGFGKPLEWSAADLTGLAIDARNVPMAGFGAFGPFSLEIDWIRLY